MEILLLGAEMYMDLYRNQTDFRAADMTKYGTYVLCKNRKINRFLNLESKKDKHFVLQELISSR